MKVLEIKEELRFGSIVENINSGKIGMVVASLSDFNRNGSEVVFVEYDGSSERIKENPENLKLKKILVPESKPERCKDCIWYNGDTKNNNGNRRSHNCFRDVGYGIFGIPSSKKGIIPIRIYPFCRRSSKK